MLDPIEEARFVQLKDLSRELKVPTAPDIFILTKVVDNDGKMLSEDIQRGHSWTRNYWNMAFSEGAEAPAFGDTTFVVGKLTSKSTSGTVYGTAGVCYRGHYTTLAYGVYESTGAGNYGILIGSGDTAFSVADYTLASKIAHGNSAGQMWYSNHITPVVAYNAGSKTWTNTIYRIFNNNSGSTITVKETGLAFTGTYFGGSYTLMERSVLASPVSVPYGGQLTVTYTISMDFSAID
jgi:hypothetical protein